ncbi:hypothetical protein A5893_02335 [Pedobacter psychrophilus]|uniref:RteC protein n=1 Tax=Pedobacter psychrophilus TaxID=1826909 RepID=A0A179DM48_9SPHI|nr:RteC domain-containing protein [Pedobacter psychrophilus]OAQ41978.1 hypothetical protein A5893_02335 [Pedobacter psychrophilus]
MIDKTFENLSKNLNIELANIEKQISSPRKKLSTSLKIIKKCLRQLKIDVLAEGFKNEEEEIYFFKKVKPYFYAKWIYVFEIHLLEMNQPKGTSEMLKNYFEGELQLINRYFKQNAYFYHYFKSGAQELDNYCFLRNADMEAIAIPEMPESEQEFATACDPLFAKFIAYEDLQNHLLYLLNPKEIQENPSLEKVIQKTLIDLSVDQLGLITRAADDARLILGKSFSKICKDLAPYIATPEKNHISSNSLRSNAYLAENSDKSNVIKTLEKMINFIKGY